MIKKIIFVSYCPFDLRDYQRFGIETIKQNGFEVESWDLSYVYNSNKIKSPASTVFDKHSIFFHQKDIIRQINALQNDCFIISMLPYSLQTFPIYRVIARKKIKHAVVIANTMPLYDYNAQRDYLIVKIVKKIANFNMIKLTRKINQLKPHKIIGSLFSKINWRIMGLSPASLILASGEKSLWCLNYPVDTKSEVLWIHQFDYDLYLRERNNDHKGDNNIAVFLDEYVPFHRDYAYMDIPPFCEAEQYYPFLRKFFDLVESQLKIKIVIAAHPRSTYELHGDVFGGRPIIKDETASLVHKAKFVIAHASTSINYAILFRKPIIFTVTKCLSQSLEGKWISTLAYLLGKNVINLSDELKVNLEKELTFNETVYRKFINDYIKREGSPEKPFWQIFADYINSKYN